MDVLWINVEYIARLIKRFTLKTIQSIPEALPLLRLVVPVTIIDELLKTTGAIHVAKDLTAAAGTFTAYGTVPDGKRWTVTWIRYPGTTGTCYLAVNDGSTTYKLGPSGTTETVYSGVQVVLEEGWALGLPTTGNGADSSIYLTALYIEEEAF